MAVAVEGLEAINDTFPKYSMDPPRTVALAALAPFPWDLVLVDGDVNVAVDVAVVVCEIT